jgi:cytidine deaminase
MNDSSIKLINHAIDASRKAYVPYSNFPVGAAILLSDNNIIHGCNIENISYPITNCAERTALFASYAQGYKKNDIISIAVVGDVKNYITPCGACRQAMAELLDSSSKIILSNFKKDVTHECTITDLLPMSFNM